MCARCIFSSSRPLPTMCASMCHPSRKVVCCCCSLGCLSASRSASGMTNRHPLVSDAATFDLPMCPIATARHTPLKGLGSTFILERVSGVVSFASSDARKLRGSLDPRAVFRCNYRSLYRYVHTKIVTKSSKKFKSGKILLLLTVLTVMALVGWPAGWFVGYGNVCCLI